MRGGFLQRAGERNRRQVEYFHEPRLLLPFITANAEQHRPMRKQVAELARLVVGKGFRQPG